MRSPHPSLGGRPIGSRNAVSVQKSFRTSDIDEVGDDTHLTFFEMLGNFSFGGYFKEEAIRYAYDFFKELGVPIQYVTIFEGDKDTPNDVESKKIWESLGVKDIRSAGRNDNFWGPTGTEGPCGPTTEIYVRDTEIWNIVFNEYYCNPDKSLVPIEKRGGVRGVDTGMGLERLAMVSQGVKTIFETDLFSPLIEMLPVSMEERTRRIFADHIRGIAFLLSDNVRPSNKGTGYILRRLMRRVMAYVHINRDKFGGKSAWLENPYNPIFQNMIEQYRVFYQGLDQKVILEEFEKEREKFFKTFVRGLNELNRMESIDTQSGFKLYESFGLPYEVIKEVGGEKAGILNREGFDAEFVKHQEISRAGRESKFGGHGLLLDTGEMKARDEEELKKATRLHTATHLLQAALRKILGGTVHQDGSDITAERLRFDFTFDRRLTEHELKLLEDWVNDVVKKDVPMACEELPFEEAKETGALYFVKEKYPPIVRVYSARDSKTGEVFSKELCGGPHVEHTGQVGRFKILKQESVGAGVRRIRATVYPLGVGD